MEIKIPIVHLNVLEDSRVEAEGLLEAGLKIMPLAFLNSYRMKEAKVTGNVTKVQKRNIEILIVVGIKVIINVLENQKNEVFREAVLLLGHTIAAAVVVAIPFMRIIRHMGQVAIWLVVIMVVKVVGHVQVDNGINVAL